MSEEITKLQVTFSIHDFSDEEITEITDALSRIEPIEEPRFYLRASAETLPELLIIALGFIGGSIAGAFFGGIGTDAYNKLKEAVKKALRNKKDPKIMFEMNYKGVEIHIDSNSKDETTIERVFDTIDKAKDIAINEIDNPASPKLTKLFIIYDENGWHLHEALDYKTEHFPIIYVYDIKGKKWERLR